MALSPAPTMPALDPARKPEARHYAFGRGIHICLGQFIARVQIEVALTIIASRLPNLAREGDVEWRPFPGIWSPATLPVRTGNAPLTIRAYCTATSISEQVGLASRLKRLPVTAEQASLLHGAVHVLQQGHYCRGSKMPRPIVCLLASFSSPSGNASNPMTSSISGFSLLSSSIWYSSW